MDTRRKVFLSLVLTGFIYFLSIPAVLSAEEPPELDSEISEALGTKWKEQFDKPDKQGLKAALRVVNNLLKKVKTTSYEYVVINQYKLQTLWASGDFRDAIEPLEVIVSSKYIKDELRVQMLSALASLYFQESLNEKEQHSAEVASQYRDKAAGVIAKIIALQPSAQMYQFLATIQYTKSQALDPSKSSEREALLKEAVENIKLATRLSIDSSPDLSQFLAAISLALNDDQTAIDAIEAFLSKKQTDQSMWRNLSQLYARNKRYLAAIAVCQRANAVGLMNESSDYSYIVDLYFRAAEYHYRELKEENRAAEYYRLAADVLANALRLRQIDTQKEDNWRYLSSLYQQMNRYDEAIDALRKGSQVAKTGAIAYSLAQFLSYTGSHEDSIISAEQAWYKGGLERPVDVLSFLVYKCRELNMKEKLDTYADILASEAVKPKNQKDAPQAFMLLAQTYSLKNEYKVARDFAARAYELAPNNKDAKSTLESLDRVLEIERRKAEQEEKHKQKNQSKT